jgi:hydroxymethylbilane synthase
MGRRVRVTLKNLRIAARHSDLARLQAYRVGGAIEKKFPEIKVSYTFRASLGDVNLTDPLWKMPEKGVFTEDFVRDLIEGEADLVVHSWKDLPTFARAETEIVATLPRADVRDLLLIRRDRESSMKATGRLCILTSSPRRAYNLESFLKTHLPCDLNEVVFETVRGNIPTRLKKMLSQDVDGLIVAKAALDRLLEAPEAEFAEVQAEIRRILQLSRLVVLPLSVNPTAAAQGALAIEIAKSNAELRSILAAAELRSILAAIDCRETFTAVSKEREILASYGGGCHQKIGISILPRPYGEITFLRGLTDAGEVLNRMDLKTSSGLTADEKAIFPRATEAAIFFDREKLERTQWSSAEGEKYLWISRESAWPDSFTPRPDAVVWTAGLTTWKNLAARGVWVMGSAEGLGEHESMQVETLLGESPDWLKLTHTTSGQIAEGGLRSCATYRLTPKAVTPDLKGRTHFFWMSGSSFDRALELFPEIRGGFHSSGPGATQRHLLKTIGDASRVAVFLGVNDFRNALCEAKN